MPLQMPLQTLNEVLIPTWDDAQKTQFELVLVF